MKYIVVIGDGMADNPIKELNNKTVLEYSKKPTMDYFAKNGMTGLAVTVPNGYIPGSDVANMAIFGYDPKIYYTGRSPLEAVSLGINLKKGDVAFRCNFITVSENPSKKESKIIDYSGGHISSDESKILINYLFDNLESEYKNKISFYNGVGYRNIAITYNNFGHNLKCTPPHDIINKELHKYYPSGDEEDFFINLINESYNILSSHPINKKKVESGKFPANCIWLWGHGITPKLKNFYDIHNKKGSVISAVDLLKGIGICAGLNIIDVTNVTGFLDTNYSGKVTEAINSLKSNDIVFIHIEAPDECGHLGDIYKKITSIEDIDLYILRPIYEHIKKSKDHFRILILPDHPTPVHLKTHTSDPVPFLIYDSNEQDIDDVLKFDERSVKNGHYGIVNGWNLLKILFNS